MDQDLKVQAGAKFCNGTLTLGNNILPLLSEYVFARQTADLNLIFGAPQDFEFTNILASYFMYRY